MYVLWVPWFPFSRACWKQTRGGRTKLFFIYMYIYMYVCMERERQREEEREEGREGVRERERSNHLCWAFCFLGPAGNRQEALGQGGA